MTGRIKQEIDQALLDTLVTVSQAARILEVESRNTVEYYIKAGRLNTVFLGKIRLVYRAEVLAIRKAKDEKQKRINSVDSM